jgi:hypothetical protein
VKSGWVKRNWPANPSAGLLKTTAARMARRPPTATVGSQSSRRRPPVTSAMEAAITQPMRSAVSPEASSPTAAPTASSPYTRRWRGQRAWSEQRDAEERGRQSGPGVAGDGARLGEKQRDRDEHDAREERGDAAVVAPHAEDEDEHGEPGHQRAGEAGGELRGAEEAVEGAGEPGVERGRGQGLAGLLELHHAPRGAMGIAEHLGEAGGSRWP